MGLDDEAVKQLSQLINGLSSKVNAIDDLYSLVSTLDGKVDGINVRLDEHFKLIKEDREEIRTVGKAEATHAEQLRTHEGRLKELEARPQRPTPPMQPPLGAYRTPSSTVFPAVSDSDLRKRAEEAVDAYAEEQTDRLRLEALEAARAEARAEAAREARAETLKIVREAREADEDMKDRRAKRGLLWVKVAAALVALAGTGGIAASLKVMTNAQATLEANGSEMSKLRKQVQQVQKQARSSPDAAVEP